MSELAHMPSTSASPFADANPLGLVQKGVTEDSAESLAFRAHLRAIDSHLADWRGGLAADLRKRAAAAHLRGDDPSWWQSRADALDAPWSDRAAGCGTVRTLTLTCGACGEVRERPVPCGLRHWCSSCADARRRREYARLLPALDARTKEARADWFRGGRRKGAPQLRLLTLTVRTQDTLHATRLAIAQAWPRFRRWLWDELGAAPAYAATWEVTDGPSGAHPHLHVCVVLPFVPIRPMAAAWAHATRGAAEAQGLDLRTVGTREAARYVAAYVTASGLDTDLSSETAAEWVRATHGRRLVTTSRAFWLPREPGPRCSCGSCEAPRVQVADARALAEARGPPIGGGAPTLVIC